LFAVGVQYMFPGLMTVLTVAQSSAVIHDCEHATAAFLRCDTKVLFSYTLRENMLRRGSMSLEAVPRRNQFQTSLGCTVRGAQIS
jgi:hypothetical protein